MENINQSNQLGRTTASITDLEFQQLTAYIEKLYGIHLKAEKKLLVAGRLHNVLLKHNCSTYGHYYKLLQNDKTGAMASELIARISTNHTNFMREIDHFHFFQEQVLPLYRTQLKDNDFRIWSAGCSSGEEPTTLAMILADFVRKESLCWDHKVLATDISEPILAKAKAGIYDAEQLQSVPNQWKASYFHRLSDGGYVVSDEIKRELIYRKFNLMEETFPFKKKFHVIFCRNVMIYFDHPTKHKLIEKLIDRIEPGGYLFLGHSESLSKEHNKMTYCMPSVYRKET